MNLVSCQLPLDTLDDEAAETDDDDDPQELFTQSV